MKYAKAVGKPPYDTISDCVMWSMSPPYDGKYPLVMTSTACNHGGLMGFGDWWWETALFPCNEQGDVDDWTEPLKTMEECNSGAEFMIKLGREIYEQTESS